MVFYAGARLAEKEILRGKECVHVVARTKCTRHPNPPRNAVTVFTVKPVMCLSHCQAKTVAFPPGTFEFLVGSNRLSGRSIRRDALDLVLKSTGPVC